MPTIGTMGIRLSRIRLEGTLPTTPLLMAVAYNPNTFLDGVAPAGADKRQDYSPAEFTHTGDTDWHTIPEIEIPITHGGDPSDAWYINGAVHSFLVTLQCKVSNAAATGTVRIYDPETTTAGKEVEFNDTSYGGSKTVLTSPPVLPFHDAGTPVVQIKIDNLAETVSVKYVQVYAQDVAVLPTRSAGGWT